jgi:hypothetical protein
MLTLEIGKMNFDEKKEPSQVVLQPLIEAATWCSLRSFYDNKLRSSELDPSAILSVPRTDEMSLAAWIDLKRHSYGSAVLRINQTRSQFLRDANVPLISWEQVRRNGKLLFYAPLETVDDGASEAGSQGFFDIEDAPPWDCWFLNWEGGIYSWVPESLVQIVQDGIDANPVDCIHWAEWRVLSYSQ